MAGISKWILHLIVVLSSSFIIKVSSDITFTNGTGIIAAFGDFDSDKLTDIFVIHPDLRKFHIMKQHEHQPYLRRLSWSCSTKSKTQKLISLIPGDFHGNTYMDVLAVIHDTYESTASKTKYDIRLVNGNGTHFRCNSMSARDPLFSSRIQPLMLDFDGDMISDLLAEDFSTGKRTVWFGSELPFAQKVSFGANDLPKMTNSSNAFIDLNCDQAADIMINSVAGMEYWFSDPVFGYYGINQSLHPNVRISYPDSKDFPVIGQSSFADIDANDDYQIEHVVPAIDKNGMSHILMLDMVCGKLNDRTKPSLTLGSSQWISIASNFSITNGNKTMPLKFVHTEVNSSKDYNFKFPISLRSGDFNGDGYADFLTIMRDDDGNDHVVILENVKSSGTSSFIRSFRVYSNQPNILNPIIAAFFDFKENNHVNHDIIYSNIVFKNNSIVFDPNDFSNSSVIQVGVRENPEEFDSDFLKILVASGRCPNNNCYKERWDGQQYRVNYGTNQPGPFITYSLLDQYGYKKYSSGGQLSQSSHFSLQTPYLIFGLGSYSNYVDLIKVTVPIENTTTRIRQLTKEEIVPGSQIIVIPHPRENPDRWIIRLFVTPSDIIFQTLYTLLGICLGLLLIIAALHKKELLDDEAEAKKFKGVYLGRK